MSKPLLAGIEDVWLWLERGVFTVDGDQVYNKHGQPLKQRLNTRQRSERGDARVDLFYEGMRRSMHVSQLVWMSNTHLPIPAGFVIHHVDEDPTNNSFDNLVCVYTLDHSKLHNNHDEDEEEEVPF